MTAVHTPMVSILTYNMARFVGLAVKLVETQ